MVHPRRRDRLHRPHADRPAYQRRVQRHARRRRSAAHSLRAAVERAGIDPGEIDDVIMGAALTQGMQFGNIGRTARAARRPARSPCRA